VNAPSYFSEDDLYLFAEGTWLRAYEKMGAHPRVVDGVRGTNVAVWAPEAESVSVLGDFNDWQAGRTPLAPRGTGGVWEAFVPELHTGDLYKYGIRSRYHGYYTEKADPYGFYAEVRPGTASIVYDLGGYTWGDAAWLERRAGTDWFAQPISVYEVHAGSWRRGPDNHFLTYRELAHELVDYTKAHGFTHVELLPITEHPFDISFGYQTTGYFAPTSRFGTPHDFMYFVDYCHQHGIGVVMDWVPSHFAMEGHGLGYFDGTHCYEHADPRKGMHLGWGTFIFNYGRHEVLTFLLSSAYYWLREYHVDGFRLDAVASMLYLDYGREEAAWLPNRYGGRENLEAVDFLRRFNDMVHQHHPGALTCAEESTTWPGVTRPTEHGGLGFDLKWNMGWMHDTLQYVTRDPLYRKYHHNEITFSFTYAFSERYILPLSHDEVIHLKRSLIGKMPGDTWQRFATLRALFAFMFAHPGKKLLFMGGEFAQWHEWDYARSLDWHLLDGEAGLLHRQVQEFVTRLNRIYAAEPALHEYDSLPEGFAWIDGSDAENSVVAVLRRAARPEDAIAVVANWTPVPRERYPIGVPAAGRWVELLSSDATEHGGSGMGNPSGVVAEPTPLDGYDYSLTLTLPPLAVLWLKPS
jgi:1,4-alpha-glucan branching enzyme